MINTQTGAIDFAAIIQRAQGIAVGCEKTKTALVSDQDVAAKILWLAERGYIPDAQTPNIVRAYLQGNGLFLSGPCGVGKTFLMTLLCARGAIQHCEREINSWGLDGIWDWYDQTASSDVVIDDLGCEMTATHYGQREDVLKMVVERRYANHAERTHVTTNLTSEQIVGRYGERILDRILGMCVPFKLDGASFRRKQSAETKREIMRGSTIYGSYVPECNKLPPPPPKTHRIGRRLP